MTTIPGLPAAASVSLDDLTAVDQSVAASVSPNGRKTRSATLSQLQSLIAGPIINVMSPPFKAKGNGVADDTIAIQAAIDFCEAQGGGTLLVPRGSLISNK